MHANSSQRASIPAINPHQLYWLEDPASDLFSEIAALVEYDAARQYLCFHNSVRRHMLEAQLLTGSAENGWTFSRPNGGSLVLRPLNCATFERVFRRRIPSAPAFRTDSELTAFYFELCRKA